MKLNEILCEDPVQSSWIGDITLQRTGANVTMKLNNGRRYLVKGVREPLFRKWLASESKGKFWHQNIKGRHMVQRLK